MCSKWCRLVRLFEWKVTRMMWIDRCVSWIEISSKTLKKKKVHYFQKIHKYFKHLCSPEAGQDDWKRWPNHSVMFTGLIRSYFFGNVNNPLSRYSKDRITSLKIRAVWYFSPEILVWSWILCWQVCSPMKAQVSRFVS